MQYLLSEQEYAELKEKKSQAVYKAENALAILLDKYLLDTNSECIHSTSNKTWYCDDCELQDVCTKNQDYSQ